MNKKQIAKNQAEATRIAGYTLTEAEQATVDSSVRRILNLSKSFAEADAKFNQIYNEIKLDKSINVNKVLNVIMFQANLNDFQISFWK